MHFSIFTSSAPRVSSSFAAPCFLLLLIASLETTRAHSATLASSAVIDLGGQRELFVDDYLIDHLSGSASLRLHEPQRREVAIDHLEPWEGNGCGFHSVFRDGDKFRMYYMTQDLSVEEVNGVAKMKMGPKGPRFVCYAESDDGIHWRKPPLGLVEFNGSKENNIVYANASIDEGGQPSEPAIFRDENPGAAPDARYKAFFSTGKKTRGIIPFKSADGLHWIPMADGPVIRDGAFDSQNLGFWDPVHQIYRAYWRYWTNESPTSPAEGLRAIRTSTSVDFVHWEKSRELRFFDSPMAQLYTNQVKPYERAPQILIGFPTRYVERGWSDSMRALPDLAARELRSKVNERYGIALTDSLIMFSRDGVNFKRWNESFLRPGPERSGIWNYGSQYIAWHLLETKSDVAGEPDELSLYATDGAWIGKSTRLWRYTLRLDGFVSLQAPYTEGELVTKPVSFQGKKLTLNFSTSAGGSVQVELQDASGRPLPGFACEDCPPLFGDSVDRVVTWQRGADLSAIRNLPVRVRFILHDADVYSFKFFE